jgi:hypothetical protein
MYPKKFFDTTQLNQKEGSCFLVMPFAPGFNRVFKLITKTLEEDLGLMCTRTDELLGGGNIIEDILRGMGESEIVVVDVTGRNPNVFYELGIAHMLKDVEKVILLSQEIDSIPFDLRPFRHIVYSTKNDGLEKLGIKLKDAVRAVVGEIHRIRLDTQVCGVLNDRLMGDDYCLYRFEALGGGYGDRSAKFRFKITRYAVHAQGEEERVIFHKGMGIQLGRVRRVPGTEWTLSLEQLGLDKYCLRVGRVDPADE